MFPIGDLSVTFKKPLDGQVAALRRVGVMFKSSDRATRGQAGTLFLDVLDTLVTDPLILQRLYEGMATEQIKLEAYADCAILLVKHFTPDEETAPKQGPVTATRRRAAARPKR